MTSKPGVKIALVLALAVPALLPRTSLAGTANEYLLKAVRTGDEVAVRALLAGRAEPNHQLPDGSTPLTWAVESQNHQMVRLLLDRGAKPNDVDATTLAPLIIACQHGDPAILDLLLTAGADPNAVRPDGVTPLSICAGKAPAPILKRLIEAGAEVDKPDARGQTPLMWAAASGRVANIKLLLEHGALVNRKTEKGFTPLFFALKSGVRQAPITVLDAGGDADYVAPDGTSVVQLAIYQKDHGFAARMIERGANLTAFDRNGNQLLHAAVLADEPPLVNLLLAKGADANALTGPAKVKMRFEVNFKTGDYEPPPKSPLLLAAESGAASVMRMLIDAGADTRFRSADGMNIVLAATTSGKLEALKLALQLDPDPNTTASDGQTPLHLLLGSGAGDEIGAMMKLLADKGARTDIKNRAGQTPADVAKDAQTDAKTAFEATFARLTVSSL